MKTIKIGLFLFLLSCLVGSGQLDISYSLFGDHFVNSVALAATNSNLAEVAPPKIIKELDRNLEQYLPQVKIVAPKAEQTFKQTDISIELEIEDLPIFRDDKLQLGNHLNLIIDNEPFQAIYSLNEPIIIKNLTPGTHTIRAFAVRPWGESFKTEGAYAQTTFNVLTETSDNRPKSNVPLLTYSSPTGTIGADPLLLDFYLTNAPLHAIAHNNPHLSDWRVRATVNGTSFILEDWQAIYLTGLKPGENWIQLELINEAGNNIENAFNNTVRVFNYDPQQQDTLAKLITNQVSLADAQSIVEQHYYIQPEEASEIIDFEDSTESEIIVDQADNIATPESASEIMADNHLDEPTVSEVSTPETNQIVEANEISGSKQTQATLTKTSDTIDLKQKIEKVDIPQTVSNGESDQTKLDAVAMADSAKSQQSIGTIIITDADSNQEPVATIPIPKPESVEISESEIAINIPPTKPAKNLLEPKQTKPASLWWKKILVSIRQKIEALAKQFPNEV